MNFRTNFSKETLMFNAKIQIYFGLDKVLISHIPLRDYYTDLDSQLFVGILNLDKDEYQKSLPNILLNSTYDIALTILLSKDYRDLFVGFLNKFFQGIEIQENSIIFTSGRYLEAEEYELLRVMFLVYNGLKDFKEYENLVKQNQETEAEKEARLKLEKVKKHKASKKKEDSKSPTIDQIVATILYHFTSFSFEDIYNMSIYSVFRYYELAIGAQTYEVKLAILSTGSVKDFKYFI
jgi:hypothetical protein